MSNEDLKKAIDLLASAKCIIDNATCDDEAFSEDQIDEFGEIAEDIDQVIGHIYDVSGIED